MKRTLLGFGFLVSLVLALGCDDRVTPRDLEKQKEAIDDAQQNVREEQQTLEAMRDRQQVEGTLKTEMDKVDQAIKMLEDRADRETDELQVELKRDIAELNKRRDEFRVRLDELKAASGDRWASAKLEMEEAMKGFQEGVRSIMDRWNQPSDRTPTSPDTGFR